MSQPCRWKPATRYSFQCYQAQFCQCAPIFGLTCTGASNTKQFLQPLDNDPAVWTGVPTHLPHYTRPSTQLPQPYTIWDPELHRSVEASPSYLLVILPWCLTWLPSASTRDDGLPRALLASSCCHTANFEWLRTSMWPPRLGKPHEGTIKAQRYSLCDIRQRRNFVRRAVVDQ